MRRKHVPVLQEDLTSRSMCGQDKPLGHRGSCLLLPLLTLIGLSPHLSLTDSQCLCFPWSMSAGPMGAEGGGQGRGAPYTNVDICYSRIKTYRCSYFGVNHVLTFVPFLKLIYWDPHKMEPVPFLRGRTCPQVPGPGEVQRTSGSAAPPVGCVSHRGRQRSPADRPGGGGAGRGRGLEPAGPIKAARSGRRGTLHPGCA